MLLYMVNVQVVKDLLAFDLQDWNVHSHWYLVSLPTPLASTQLSFSAYQQDNGTSWHDFGQQSIEWHSTHSKIVLPAISPKLPTKTKDMCSLPRYTTNK